MIATASVLSRYIGRNFLLHFLVMMLVMLGLVFIFDTIELLRRASTHEGVTFDVVTTMAFLKLPDAGQTMIPFGVLFGAIYTCWKLNKTHELMVIRSAGISAWQFLGPIVAAAVLIGVCATAVINPVSSVFFGKYERMERNYLKTNDDLVTVSRTGIWLRQPLAAGYALIHSEGFSKAEWRLSKALILSFDDQDNFQQRIDSPLVYLKEGHWDIRSALVNDKAGETRRLDTLQIPTALTARKIEESFADPETISFWQIPEYIHIMEETGFPATRLDIYFQSLLAKPFLLAALVLLAATFSLRPPRFGGTALMIALGVATGFLIFFMESMLHAFGISQKIPVILAAWTPAVIGLLAGVTALLHLEDG